MSQTVAEPPITRKRIRELTAAHTRAWNERAKFLRESPGILPAPHKELIQRVSAPVLALLQEGVPEQPWLAASRKLCVLVDRQDGELLVRCAPRKVVQAAPQTATAEDLEHGAHSPRASGYRGAFVAARSISGWASVVAVGLFASGTVVGLLTGSQSVLRVAVWCAIAAMFALAIYMLMCKAVPQEELAEEHREFSAGDGPGGEPSGEDADVVPLHRATQSARSGASTAIGSVSPEDGADVLNFAYEAAEDESAGQRPGVADVYENLDMSQQEFLGYELQALPEGNLAEGFAHARALPDNDAQGSDDIRVVEARGELASVLGIEQGEAVVEIVWATSPRALAGGGRSSHSYLPYREVVSGTSLDPQRRPAERFRPACRHALHERLIEEKGLGALQRKVTYRVGPDSYQFFDCPMWSGGSDGGYVLEDKLKYLMERAPELGFENDYDVGEWRRMKEIAVTTGEPAPTHEQLLRFALIPEIDPRFLFEDSGEDLRNRMRLGSDPGQPVLWRIEGVISEAHGLPVEVFERRLMDWRMAPYSWRFR